VGCRIWPEAGQLSSGRYTADWPTPAGIGAGAIALRFGRSPAVVFLLAIATTAVARLVS